MRQQVFIRIPYILLLLWALTALIIAFYLQFFADLDPCILCVYQRYPYLAVVIVAIIALITLPSLSTVWHYSTIAILVSAVLLALFHFGIEVDQQWWQGFDSCASLDVQQAQNLDELLSMLHDSTPCNKPAMLIFGLSLTFWNMTSQLVVLAFVLFAHVIFRNAN
jgi:disulfide bond formation protein DsbB